MTEVILERDIADRMKQTPYCITYDFDSETDGCVTVRDRDTMKQERVKIADLKAYFENKFIFQKKYFHYSGYLCYNASWTLLGTKKCTFENVINSIRAKRNPYNLNGL